MHLSLTEKAVCPKCKGQLETSNEEISCRNCQFLFSWEEGIPLFIESKTKPLVDRDTHDVNLETSKEAQIDFYTRVGKYMNEVIGELGFEEAFNYLNFGYASDGSKEHSNIELEDLLINKNSVKLTLEVVGDVSLKGKKVLEVGCGRGGNIVTINKYHAPEELCGVDLCPYSVAYATRTHQYDNMSFLVGDAEQIPLPDNYFDVVFNLESSHAYPNRSNFYQEVFRVLKPGGYFLYSDMLPTPDFFLADQYLRDLGFELLVDRDITGNILNSCDEIAATRSNVFQNLIQNNEQKALEDFIAVPGSEVYDTMQSRKRIYKILQLQKA